MLYFHLIVRKILFHIHTLHIPVMNRLEEIKARVQWWVFVLSKLEQPSQLFLPHLNQSNTG